MLAHPEMVGGNRDRLDTSLMKAIPGRVVSKAGMEALRGLAILPGPRVGGATSGATGMAVKIEDGDGYDRGTWAASVEALRQAGVLEGQVLRQLGATTGRRSSTRTAAWAPSRSRTSSWRRSAS